MIEALVNLNFIAYYTLGAAILYYALSKTRNFSLVTTALIVLVSDAVVDTSLTKLASLFQTFLSPVLYKTLAYFTYTFSHLIAVFAILQVHKIYHEGLCFAARQTANAFLVLGGLHMILYLASFLIERKLFLNIYHVVNSSIYTGVLLTVIACIVKDIIPGNLSVKWERES